MGPPGPSSILPRNRKRQDGGSVAAALHEHRSRRRAPFLNHRMIRSGASLNPVHKIGENRQIDAAIFVRDDVVGDSFFHGRAIRTSLARCEGGNDADDVKVFMCFRMQTSKNI